MSVRGGPGEGADVVLVVDPVQPGAATLRTQRGELLVEVTARAVTDDVRTSHPVPVADSSRTATADTLAAMIASSTTGRFVLVDGATLTARTVFGDLIAGPTAVYGDIALVLRDGEGRALAVRVPAAARAEVAEQLVRAVTGSRSTRVLEDLLAACAASGLDVQDLSPAPFPAWWVATAGELDRAHAELVALDEPALRLRRASRHDDGFLSTFLVRPPSRWLTRYALRWGASPATVTACALVLGLAAAGAYAGGDLGWRLLGSVLLLLSLTVDCVDGQVARYTRTTSARGAWLDVGADRVKEYAVYAALAGGVAGTAHGTWGLALAALGVLVTRHFVDFAFATTRDDQADGAPAPPAQGAVAGWSARTDRRPAAMWAKRAVIMPVGERTILLVVLVPLAGARWALLVMLALGVVAAAWTTAGRVGRTLGSRGWLGVRPDGRASARLAAQVDGGPVPARTWPVHRRAGWLLPAAARLVEQAATAGAVWLLAPAALPAVYAWLAVVAIAEYDAVYRQRLLGAVGPTGPLRGLGWPVRLPAVALLALAVPDQAAIVLLVAAAVLAVAVAASSARAWWRSVPSTP